MGYEALVKELEELVGVSLASFFFLSCKQLWDFEAVPTLPVPVFSFIILNNTYSTSLMEMQ